MLNIVVATVRRRPAVLVAIAGTSGISGIDDRDSDVRACAGTTGLRRFLTIPDDYDGPGAAKAAAAYPFCSSRRIHSLLRCISLRNDSSSV